MLFKQIKQNKRNTWIVMIMFVLLLLTITVLLSACLTPIVGLIFLGTGLIYLWRIYFNATRHLMTVTNAKEIKRADNPKLYELVEEMSLAAGLPMPKVYITPDPIPNAFATGRDPEHASLAVTQGLLDVMNHDELLGVIGHEMSHIRNYDVRVTTISSGLYSFIFLAAIWLLGLGWTLLTTSAESLLGKAIKYGLGGLCLIVGGGLLLIALPIAKLLNLATSRQREYLADVGSVDLTRNPDCIMSALQKLQQIDSQYIENQDDLMVKALAFNTYKVKHWWTNLLSDHPTLDKRIERLEHTADM